MFNIRIAIDEGLFTSEGKDLILVGQLPFAPVNGTVIGPKDPNPWEKLGYAKFDVELSSVNWVVEQGVSGYFIAHASLEKDGGNERFDRDEVAKSFQSIGWTTEDGD